MSVAVLIRRPEELSSAWLDAVLGGAGRELLGAERIGTGQMSQSHRVTYVEPEGGEATVVVKLASDDPTSRATGVGMGAYYREIAFYRDLAGRIGGPLAALPPGRVRRCRRLVHARSRRRSRRPCRAIRSRAAPLAQAEVAMRALARLHAPVLGDLALGTADFLNQPNPLDQALLMQLLPAFLERYGERVADEHAELCRAVRLEPRCLGRGQAPSARSRPWRLPPRQPAVRRATAAVVVDWQTVSWGPAMLDASYFIGGCLDVETRRAAERELLAVYHEALLARAYEGFASSTAGRSTGGCASTAC